MMMPNLTWIGIVIDFKINQDFIAEFLCINKNKPESTCNGKCHLSDQLKKAEEEEKKQASNTIRERTEIICFCSKSSLKFRFFADRLVDGLNPVWIKDFYSFSYLTYIFRPPKLRFI
jgi:hypothetical protein